MISQIITGHVLRTVVEHMNILSVLHDSQCMSGIYHYHTGKGSRKNLQTFFREWSVMFLENFALMDKTLFHDRQNPDSMMVKPWFHIG